MGMTNTTRPTLSEVLEALGSTFPIEQSGGRAAAVTILGDQIRKDLATATKLGLFPKGTKFSVRKNAGRYYSSRAGSWTVSIAAWPGAVYCDAYIECRLDGHSTIPYESAPYPRRPSQRYSEAFAAALDNAQKIADRHNYNRSDLMTDHFDVGYYLNVHGGKAEAAASAALKEEADAAVAYRSKPVPTNYLATEAA